MKMFREERGNQHRLTVPYNPHQNGVSEILHRNLMKLVRSMFHQNTLPKTFWAEALSVAAHVHNRVTTCGLNCNTTPFQVLFGRHLNMSYLRVFGFRCWYTVQKSDVDKLDPCAREAIMIRYARLIWGYQLWDTEQHKVVVSLYFRFDESDEYYCGEKKPLNI